mmetsp:Transcript_15701/g.40320  ORF Transcript_15701/g.40320 Transcript_15701/m.40320 type:complete len:262 (+) Transcript_15701:2206-2991(+)
MHESAAASRVPHRGDAARKAHLLTAPPARLWAKLSFFTTMYIHPFIKKKNNITTPPKHRSTRPVRSPHTSIITGASSSLSFPRSAGGHRTLTATSFFLIHGSAYGGLYCSTHLSTPSPPAPPTVPSAISASTPSLSNASIRPPHAFAHPFSVAHPPENSRTARTTAPSASTLTPLPTSGTGALPSSPTKPSGAPNARISSSPRRRTAGGTTSPRDPAAFAPERYRRTESRAGPAETAPTSSHPSPPREPFGTVASTQTPPG